MGFPDGSAGKEPAYQCRRIKRCEFISWFRKIPWRRKWQPTPVFLPGKFHGPGDCGPQSTGSQRVGHDWACACPHIHRLFYNIRFLVPILSSGSSWHNFHRETILTHLTNVTIKDFKGKYRTDHLESKLKICYQRQLNILRKLVLFTKRKIKFKFCASLRLKSTYSMKFFLNWANQEAAKQ